MGERELYSVGELYFISSCLLFYVIEHLVCNNYVMNQAMWWTFMLLCLSYIRLDDGYWYCFYLSSLYVAIWCSMFFVFYGIITVIVVEILLCIICHMHIHRYFMTHVCTPQIHVYV